MEYAPEAGGAGRIGFRQAVPGRVSSFRWTHPEGAPPRADNSFLVVFELGAQGSGTLLWMSETGFRERGRDEATAAAA